MKIQANGIRINYELIGKAGTPVVMLSHSLATNMAMWDAQIGALSANYQVLRYDMRGHGESEASAGNYSFAMLADDALGLLQALNIPRCHFVGLSIGGMIGQTLALRAAPQIASVALCATTSRVPSEMHSVWDDRIAAVMKNGMASIQAGTMERWFTVKFFAAHVAEVARVGNMIATTPVAGFAGCAAAIKSLDLTAQLKRITLPTLLIAGRDDPSTPVAASEVIQREIVGSTLVVLDDAMHICNIEQAEKFNQALLAFLAQQV